MLLLLFLRRFIPYQFTTTANKGATFKKLVCKGWTCDSDKYFQHQIDEFEDAVDDYESGEIDKEFPAIITGLLKRGFEPSLCAIGLFQMIGFGNFEANLTLSYENLKNGSEKGFTACDEALSFHPYEENTEMYLRRAASKGGIWSMTRLGLSMQNESESYELLSHVAMIICNNWWKKRNSGKRYANAVEVILNMQNGSVTKAWQEIEELSNDGILPASIWKAEGLRTGEIGRKNMKEAINILRDIVSHSGWVIDAASAIESNDKFNLRMVLNISSMLGNDISRALLSVPSIIDAIK